VVTKQVYPSFPQAAVKLGFDALMRGRWRPPMWEGQPVKARTTVAITYIRR